MAEKFTAFLVERGHAGLTVGAEEHKLGIRGSSTCPLVLADCKVPVENLLGEVGKGHHIAFNILNIGRYKLGARLRGRGEDGAAAWHPICKGAQGVRQADLRVWTDPGEDGRLRGGDLCRRGAELPDDRR